jgi:hypothetical protein
MPGTTQDIQNRKNREKATLEQLFSAASAKLELQPGQAKTLIAICNALIELVNNYLPTSNLPRQLNLSSTKTQNLLMELITTKIQQPNSNPPVQVAGEIFNTIIHSVSTEAAGAATDPQAKNYLTDDNIKLLKPRGSKDIVIFDGVSAANLYTILFSSLTSHNDTSPTEPKREEDKNREANHLLIPVSHNNSHWRLVHIDKSRREINVLDSLGEKKAEIISDSVKEIKKINDFNDFGIVYQNMGSLRQNAEGYTCGDRVIIKAHHIVKELDGECNETLAALATGNNQPKKIRTAIINAHKLYTQAKRMASSPAPELTDTDTSDTDTSDTESNASSNSSITSTTRPTADIKQVANDNAEKLKEIIKGLGDKAENTNANIFILNAKKIVKELDRNTSQQSTASPSAPSYEDYTNSSILKHALNGYSLFTENLVGDQELHPQSESGSESESESDVSKTQPLTDPELAMQMQTDEIKIYINSFGSPSN